MMLPRTLLPKPSYVQSDPLSRPCLVFVMVLYTLLPQLSWVSVSISNQVLEFPGPGGFGHTMAPSRLSPVVL